MCGSPNDIHLSLGTGSEHAAAPVTVANEVDDDAVENVVADAVVAVTVANEVDVIVLLVPVGS
jgi:hypothetical protein